jgi:hypothetical protein
MHIVFRLVVLPLLLVSVLVRDTGLLHGAREQLGKRGGQLVDLVDEVLGVTGDELGSSLKLARQLIGLLLSALPILYNVYDSQMPRHRPFRPLPWT